MAAREELQVLTGFDAGHGVIRVFAVQPDEWSDDSWAHRTFVFDVQGDRASHVETLAKPIHECWRSRSGVAHLPSKDGQLLRMSEARWLPPEQICARDEEFGAIFGIESADGQFLVVCGSASLFVRASGDWSEVALPDDVGEVYRLHGSSPQQVYVCTDAGLFRYDGKAVAPVQTPDDELLDVHVFGAGEMIGVGERVHRWSDGIGWRTLKSSLKEPSQGMCRIGEQLFVPGLDGVGVLQGPQVKKVGKFGSNQLFACGTDVVAAGADGGLGIFDGSVWRRIAFPKLAPGDPL